MHRSIPLSHRASYGGKKRSKQSSPHHLDVPGGRLYYEVRGSGPLLLVIDQPMTSGPFGPLADLLAEDHTVVTYDPHGLGASTIQDPSLDVTPEIEGDDLAHLVDAVGGERADAFGSSGGAIAALAFAARHPDKAGTVIAHEPPVNEFADRRPARTHRGQRCRGCISRVRVRRGVGQIRLPCHARRAGN